jgi:hypothetical protein
VSVSGGKLTVNDNKVTVRSLSTFSAPYRIETRADVSGEPIVVYGVDGIDVRGPAYSLAFSSSEARYYKYADLDDQNSAKDATSTFSATSPVNMRIDVLSSDGKSRFYVDGNLVLENATSSYYTDSSTGSGGYIALGAWYSKPASFYWVRVRPYADHEPYLPLEFMSYTSPDYSYSVSCLAFKTAYTADDEPTNAPVKFEHAVFGSGDAHMIIAGTGRFVPFTTNATKATLYFPVLKQDGSSAGPEGDYIPLTNWFAVFKIDVNNVTPVDWKSQVQPVTPGTTELLPVVLEKSSTARISCCDWKLRYLDLDYTTSCTLVSGSVYQCSVDPDGLGPNPPVSAKCDMSLDCEDTGYLKAGACLVPAYFADSTLWSQLISSTAGNKPMYVVVNVNNGPGAIKNSSYESWIHQLIENSKIPVGYVYTSYGSRAISDVENDIDRWLSFYPEVKGFFIDEVNATTSNVSYYQSIVNYIKGKGDYVVILNPGVVPADKTYFDSSMSDLVVTFEGNGTSALSAASSSHREKSACLVHGTSASDFSTVYDSITSSSGANCAVIYITDDTMPNPWDTLPSYFNTELQRLSTE